MPLFDLIDPPKVDGIDLRCCGVDELVAELRSSNIRTPLVMADPPWRYARSAGGANPEQSGIYAGLSNETIVTHLDATYDIASDGARLACWYTWPKDAEWNAAGGAGPRWGSRVTGGAWSKMTPTLDGGGRCDQIGVGYHWRGCTEPIAMFTKGATGRPDGILLNGHVSPPGDHSEKPIGWLREMIRAWVPAGGLVVDLYAGMAPLARACRMEGRRYIGCEIDPERHRAALDRLAMVRR